MAQGIEVRLTLESDFAGLENGFTGVPSQIAAASGTFRTAGEKREPDSIPIGQNRTPAHASDEQAYPHLSPTYKRHATHIKGPFGEHSGRFFLRISDFAAPLMNEISLFQGKVYPPLIIRLLGKRAYP
ncbi:hypothetical protein DQG23_19790 [Paenibacillus contaminans]|uniref:Uncharacterized protein n=1 Tax=Paenibacillus contaminans TaxID=450362 RepID=A0A329MJ29_9BACL|nr:hypothetical protein DQG23_19790 [Paenibacillus contaminans]